MSQPDDTLASSKVDMRFLLTLGVVFAGVIVGWTSNREAVRENAEDVVRISQALDGVTAEQARLGNRILTIENGLVYRSETVEAINAKINRLLELQGAPAGDRDGR